MKRRAKLFDVKWTVLGACGWDLDEIGGFPGASKDDPCSEAFAALVYDNKRRRFNLTFLGSLRFLVDIYCDLVKAGAAPYVIRRDPGPLTLTGDTTTANGTASEMETKFLYWQGIAA